MNPTWLLATALCGAVPPPAAAADRHASAVCPQARPSRDGVSCCASTTRNSSCEAVAARRLRPDHLAVIKDLHERIRKDEFGFRTPNCLWASLRFSDYGGRLWFGSMSSKDFMEKLAEEYARLGPEDSPAPGDLVVFAEEGELRTPRFGPDGSLANVDWLPAVNPFHSAIYLGDGLVFQKDDMSSAAFSVSTLAESRKYYFGEWRYDPVWSLRNPKLRTFYYRRKGQPE